MDIIIDTKGQADLASRDCLIDDDEDDIEFEETGNNPLPEFRVDDLLMKEEKRSKKKKSVDKKDIDLEEFEYDMGWKNNKIKPFENLPSVSKLTKELTPLEKILEKSAIKPGFEQLETVPPYDESEKRLRIQRQKEREKTKGKNWFNLPATEVTDEIKHDLEVIQMRSVLDPKHFYKKNDLKVLPKYFQVGKVLDSPIEYYCGRLTKKERKKTIVDELMANAEFAKYNKRKYKEVIGERKKLHYKAHRHSKKLKGKKGKKK